MGNKPDRDSKMGVLPPSVSGAGRLSELGLDPWVGSTTGIGHHPGANFFVKKGNTRSLD